MIRAPVVTIVVLAAVLFAACENGDTITPDPTPSPGEEAYLVVLCTGLDRFSSALVAEETEEGIRQVIIDYIEILEAVEPPEDARSFHEDFIEYLSESQENPRELVLLPRPRPEDSVRSRLAAAERNVEECEDLAFFTNVDDNFAR